MKLGSSLHISNAGRSSTAMTLVEVVVALAILLLVMAGLIDGYVQINRYAEWSSMSLAAQSAASQGLEMARAALWDSSGTSPTNGPNKPGTEDEFPPWTNVYCGTSLTNYSSSSKTNTVYYGANYTLDIPSGTLIYYTNVVGVSSVNNPTNPPLLRQIRSDCIWTFPLTKVVYTNTVITLRAPDE